MEEAEATPVPFNRPKDFDLQAHLAKLFGVFRGDEEHHVVVEFSPVIARYVAESTWHASQKLTAQRDGTVVAEFDLDNRVRIDVAAARAKQDRNPLQR